MGRFRPEFPAFHPAQVEMIHHLFRPSAGIVQAALLRSQVHPLPESEGDYLGQFLAVHAHIAKIQGEQIKNKCR
jgi:hypothetical protein